MTQDRKTPMCGAEPAAVTAEELHAASQRRLVAEGIALWNRTEERFLRHGTIEPEVIPPRPLD